MKACDPFWSKNLQFEKFKILSLWSLILTASFLIVIEDQTGNMAQ